jgi:hypothetical protein
VDDEVDALLDGPAELLLVLGADDRPGALRVSRVIGPGVADVRRHERVALGGDLVRHPQRRAVHRLQVAVAPDDAQLLTVGVVGERHHHVGAGREELTMQAEHRRGRVEHDLGDIGAGFDEAAAFELEDIALGADHEPLRQSLVQRSR